MRYKILSIILLLLISKFIMAQEKGGIRGIVKDYNNNEILSGVTIIAEPLMLGTSTDKDGHYELFLPEGSYNIRFSFIGYNTEDKEITIYYKFNILNMRKLNDDEELINVG